MRHRLPLLLLLLGAFVVAIILWPGSKARSVALPGGGTVELKEVTYGMTHLYSRGSLRNRLLHLLPEQWRRKFGIRGPRLSTGSTNLALWVERDGAGEVTFLACDETGAGVASEISARMSVGGATEFAEAWCFNTFPRRQKEFIVRIVGPPSAGTAGPLLGEWTIPNPAFQAYPVWTPEPLPATRTAGELAVTLQELKTGVEWPRTTDSKYPTDFPGACTRAVFALTQGGAPAVDWEPVGIETSDATGNRRKHTSWTAQSSNGWHTVHYQWGLWPGESAWRLKVELSRRAHFPPDQLWTVRRLGLAETNLALLANSRTNFQGEVVQLERLVAPTFPGRPYTLFLTVLPHREDLRLSIGEAIDDGDRPVRITGEGFSGGHRTFDLEVAQEAKWVNLTFALRPSLFVEFTARPEAASASRAGTGR